jgi:hypothetical protein
MFKMKYLINKMQCNILSQQMCWFDGKGVCFHPRGQGIKTSQMVFMINNGKLTKYFPM